MSDWLERVHAHADGELDAAAMAEVDELLAKEPRAAAEHQWAVYLKQTLYTKHLKPDHADAWQKCRGRLDAIDALQGNAKIESFVGRFSWGFAAALLGVIVLAGLLNRGEAKGELSTQELAGLFTGNTVTSEQSVSGAVDADNYVRRETGKPLPMIEPVIDVKKAGKGSIDGRDFLRLELVDNVGTFMLFIFQGTGGFESFEPVPGRREFFGGKINNQECVGWTDSGATYMVVGTRSTDEFVLIADRMRR